DTNPDVLAFHEAFADIVALFQHFTYPEVLKNQIAATRGNLASQNLLGKLAQEFGIAIGGYSSLRDAIGSYDKDGKWTPTEPKGDEYRKVFKPHDRGAILVAAVFEAFLSIYKNRIADLLRLATGGTGVLPIGEISPDLVNRLSAEAAKSSRHVLNMCIRALDYCPPVDITFGDFLRAVITADSDLVPDDNRDYRIAFISAFRRRGIYPSGAKQILLDTIGYTTPATTELQKVFTIIAEFLRDYRNEIIYAKDRESIFNITRKYVAGTYEEEEKVYGLHRRLKFKYDESIAFERLTGLMFNFNYGDLGIRTSSAYGSSGPAFAINSLHYASRVGPDGKTNNQIVVSLVQHARVELNAEKKAVGTSDETKGTVVSGGCTLIFDLDSLSLKYAISKPLLDVDQINHYVYQLDQKRISQLLKYQNQSMADESRFNAYFRMKMNPVNEPFNFLHNH
ncbi:MAG TPA: hypothetical protein VI461_08485, partial [Chitinophagaceae bacterium]|nr:hypothetical protein [Chitinophagaceae bacterium]